MPGNGYGSTWRCSPERRETMRLHKAFSLLTPDGEKIDLPSQLEYRAGFDEINTMEARAANLQLTPWLAIPQCKPAHFAGWDDIPIDHRPDRPAGESLPEVGGCGATAASIGPCR